MILLVCYGETGYGTHSRELELSKDDSLPYYDEDEESVKKPFYRIRKKASPRGTLPPPFLTVKSTC